MYDLACRPRSLWTPGRPWHRKPVCGRYPVLSCSWKEIYKMRNPKRSSLCRIPVLWEKTSLQIPPDIWPSYLCGLLPHPEAANQSQGVLRVGINTPNLMVFCAVVLRWQHGEFSHCWIDVTRATGTSCFVNDAFGTTSWLFQDVSDVTFIVFHRVALVFTPVPHWLR
jgi:hypothetical protein